MQRFSMAIHAFAVVCILILPATAELECLAQEAKGQTAQNELQELVSQVLAAKDQFRPYPAERVPQARARLEKAMQQLEPYFSQGTAENTARWKKYLRWEMLLEELAKPEGPDLRNLGIILSAYYQNYTALDHPYFVAMRAALLDVRAAYLMSANRRLEQETSARLQVLARQLEAYERAPTLQLRRAIGSNLARLEMAEQATEVVQMLRDRYWHPNLHASISQRLVNTGLSVVVDETEDVTDCILGTRLLGTATMRGRTQAELIDDNDRAHLYLTLTGTIHSENIGFNRSVRVWSRGETQVTGYKNVFLDIAGVASDKSSVTCETDSSIDAIRAPSCLVERIARKRARRTKSQAERIGSQHAEERVEEKMEERADELLAQVRETYEERFRKPLVRRDEFPQDMRYSTRRGMLNIAWRQANNSQLAASGLPDPLPGGEDLGVRVHESFVSNFSSAMLAGVRLSDERVVELLENNDMEVPEKLQLGEEKRPWAITFSARAPAVSATFSDNTIRFAIRGDRFEADEMVVTELTELSAVYRIEKTPIGARFLRQGDVSVKYLEEAKGGDAVVVKVIMREKFEALFAPVIELESIRLPERWAGGGDLNLQHITAEKAWLSAAWIQSKFWPTDPASTSNP
jgi:hypothetical protein